MDTTTPHVAPAEALALHGGTPVRAEPIATVVEIGTELRGQVLDLLGSGELSDYYNGRHARRLEAEFARYHGHGSHAVAVNSGTSGLHLSLHAAGVGPGDEVIVPTMCYVSAAAAVVQLGGVPVICDVEPRSLTLDVDAAEALVGDRTKAVLPVHFWGYPADLARLRALCDRHGLTLVEDAAQAPGAEVGGRKVGTYGDFAAYSLGVRKHIACGEGGLVLCRTAEAADVIRSLSNVGKGPGWDDYRSLGYSYRMVEFSALVALDGLARLDEEVAARQRAAAHYRDVLATTELTPVPDPRWGDSVYFKLPVLLPEEFTGRRPFVVDAIAAENVSCRIPHRPLHTIDWLARYLEARGRAPSSYPVTEALHPRLFEVETGPHLPPAEAARSAAAVTKVWAHVLERGHR